MISVVESIWNLPGKLLDCNLATLTRQTEPPLEIIVVNASSDKALFAEVEAVCLKYPLVRMISAPMDTFNLSRNTNVGIRASKGEYTMMTAIDQLFSPAFVAEVYKAITPNRMVQSSRGELPIGFDVGDPQTIVDRWDNLLAQATKPKDFSPGAIMCPRREWLEKVHGLDETRNKYTYCDSDLGERSLVDGLTLTIIGWGKAQILHMAHPRNTALYYGVGGKPPQKDLPVVRNLEGWGI